MSNNKIIHDINNILTSINLSVDLLLQEIEGPLTLAQKKSLKLIMSEGKKIQKLIVTLKEEK